MRAFFAALILLAGCASTEMRPYVGRPVEDVLLAYGQPEQVVNLEGGRRAYQYRWGGGTAIIPGTANSTATTTNGVTHVTTTQTPAIATTSRGCLMAFITSAESGREIVTEVRPPREAVC